MKTVSVRIREDQAKQAEDFADQTVGCSRDRLVQRAWDVWWKIEGTVLMDANKEARERLWDGNPELRIGKKGAKRQAVVSSSVAA